MKRMPRKTARQETERMVKQFIDESKAAYLVDIQATRVYSRRRQLLYELDALDTVAAKFYNWLTSLDDAA